MPSRKKAQGKARKAAKAEVAAEAARKETDLVTQLNRLHMVEGYDYENETCTHGYETDKICGDFVKHFLDIVDQVPMNGKPHGAFIIYDSAAEASREKFPKVWRSKRKLSKIDSLFLALGTNYTLSGDIERARQCAASAHYFREEIEVVIDDRPIQMKVQKTAELFASDEHTLVRYLQKRIPCSCLDAKYQEVKGIKKIGFCCNGQCKIPDRITERSTMFYCTRCRFENYCSAECQKVQWHAGHKEECEKMRRERKAYKSSKKRRGDRMKNCKQHEV